MLGLFNGSTGKSNKETAIMTQRILDECSRRGTCPLNRKEFDETFAGSDLTVQVRSALDFARLHDLAFARSLGDQAFVFSRLPKMLEGRRNRQANERPPLNHSARPRRGSRQEAKGQNR